jgi:OHCU decarboxylase
MDNSRISVSALPSIEELNAVSRDEFARALRPLFEAADPLAHALFAARPYASYGELLDKAAAIVNQLPLEQQIEVINAHPRIGADAALVREASTQSYREQGYADEAGLDPEEVRRTYEQLAELNRTYEQRFGFRFVVFVNRRPKAEIVRVLRERLHGTPDAERQIALADMLLIARDRLQRLLAAEA